MYYNTKALYFVLAMVATSSSTTMAQRGGGTRGASGPPGRDDSRGDRPADGGRGPGGRGPGGKMERLNVTLVHISCDSSYDCALPNGEDGFFVCRGLHDIVTGEERFKALCIANDEAWANVDECGCCGEVCPEQPDYQEITCDEIPVEFNIPPRRDEDEIPGDVAVVCRDVFDRFTGAPSENTALIPTNRALEGDSCGCCDDVCPERGDQRPERPEHVEKSCTDEVFVACDIPRGRRHKRHDESDEEVEEEGFFVCRQTYDFLTGELKEEAKCITGDTAWDSDVCGCCGDDCPEDERGISHVEIECLADDSECELPRGGGEGVYVCRFSYDPLIGELEEQTLCIPTDKAWETDVCGCCADTGCPLH